MSISKMKKEELELMSNKDITCLLLEENGKMNTADLYREIIKLLELPASTFDKKIGDYFTGLTNDKRFILLDDGCWDLRNRHSSDKVVVKTDLEDDEDIEDLAADEVSADEIDEDEDNYDSVSDNEFSDDDDDLKDLVVVDEDELELEQ